MTYLFQKTPLKILESFCYSKTLFAFDFDGTLAPIVDNPDQARISADLFKDLRKLAASRPVAIISGRALADVKERIPPNIPWVIGNHGFEGLSREEKVFYPLSQMVAQWSATFDLPSLRAHGIELENKKYSLSLHYRNSKVRKTAKAWILGCVAELLPAPRLVLGKEVINLIPPGAPHKGLGLLELMKSASCTSALFVGDDVTDEDVFTLGEDHLLKIRVESNADSRADYYLKEQHEMNLLLRHILQTLAPGKEKSK